MGYWTGPILGMARAAAGNARMAGRPTRQVRSDLALLLREPQRFAEDPHLGKLAAAVVEAGLPDQLSREASTSAGRGATHADTTAPVEYRWNETLEYRVWGDDIDPAAHEQMRNACRLPISVAGALMPDATSATAAHRRRPGHRQRGHPLCAVGVDIAYAA
jgi:tRNA-splicing ligase RtcB